MAAGLQCSTLLWLISSPNHVWGLTVSNYNHTFHRSLILGFVYSIFVFLQQMKEWFEFSFSKLRYMNSVTTRLLVGCLHFLEDLFTRILYLVFKSSYSNFWTPAPKKKKKKTLGSSYDCQSISYISNMNNIFVKMLYLI